MREPLSLVRLDALTIADWGSFRTPKGCLITKRKTVLGQGLQSISEKLCIIQVNKTKISHEKNKKTAFLKAKEYIDENYSNLEISLQNVCENIHLSQSYCRSIFKQETGMTFGNYLTTLRMDKSKKMITETNLKNYEIAELVGYSDPHYFSYCFKKFYGMSPNHYRKRQTSKL